MKALQTPILALMALTVDFASAAGFQTFQNADVVLGQPNFNENTGTSGQSERFNRPRAVVMDPVTGKVFISDSSNHRILRFSSDNASKNGSQPEAVFGQQNFSGSLDNQGGTPSKQTLHSPRGLAIDPSRRLWVADFNNHRVLAFYVASELGNNPPADLVLGQPNFDTGNAPAAANAVRMNMPMSVFVDQLNTLWVADTAHNRVLRFDNVDNELSGNAANGVLGQQIFTTNAASAMPNGMTTPRGVYTDTGGHLWVTDTGNNRVLRFDGAVLKADGSSADGMLTSQGASAFNEPTGVYCDPSGALWIGDNINNRILRFSNAVTLPDNSIADLVIGQPDLATTTTPVSVKSTRNVNYIGGGPGGSLLVADTGNNRVLRFSPAPALAAPRVVITVKGKKKITTTRAKLVIKGTAASIGGQLVRVEVKLGKKYKLAKGTVTWKYTATLKPGTNKILARAVDISGTMSVPLKISVIKQ